MALPKYICTAARAAALLHKAAQSTQSQKAVTISHEGLPGRSGLSSGSPHARRGAEAERLLPVSCQLSASSLVPKVNGDTPRVSNVLEVTYSYTATPTPHTATVHPAPLPRACGLRVRGCSPAPSHRAPFQ